MIYMGPFQARRRSAQQASFTHLVCPAITSLCDQEASRHEPQTLASRAVAPDPYTAWAEQRDAERQREQGQPIRWIYRQRELAAQETRATADGDREPRRAHDNVDRRSPIELINA
jgi:hypothetical protein